MIFRHLLLSIVTIIASLCCTDAYFASQNQQWTSNGPYGGEVLSVAVDPVSSERIYAGTAYGGVFKSIEGGLKGVPITIGQIEYVTSIAIDPLEPQNVYAGNWQELHTSSNSGETWTKINDKAGSSITINPLNPDIIYVVGSDRMVYNTTDGGQKWEAVTDTLAYLPVDMAIDPTNPDVVYVLIGGGPIFKTTDAGSTWSDAIYAPLFAWSVVIDPNRTDTLYVGGCVGMAEGRIARSTDGGTSWATLYSSQIINSSVESMCIDPSDSDVLFAGTPKEILRSSNNGQTWEKVYILSEDLEYTNDVNSLCIDPQNPSTVYAGLHAGGVLKSVNGGFNWSKVEMGYPMITALAKDPQDETILYAGSREGLFRSFDGGESWLETEIKKGRITSIEIDPIQTNIIYVTGPGVQKSTDYGYFWTEIDSGVSLAWETPYSIAIHPDSTNLLYLGTGGMEAPSALYKSTNGGESWEKLLRGSVGWITIDPTNTAIMYAYIFANTFMPGLAKSYDSGLNWECILPEVITTLTIDPANSNVLYTGTCDIFKSINAGSTWFSINEGLPLLTGHILSIIVDPSNSDILFAQTVRQGVYKSTNGGAMWTEMDPQLPFKQGDYSYNLEHTLVLAREGDYLLHAGTQAGVWSLSAPPDAKGDVNRDGTVNVLDVIRAVNIILELPPSPTEYELWAADFNSDGEVNILDVVGIVNKILNPAFSISHILGE